MVRISIQLRAVIMFIYHFRYILCFLILCIFSPAFYTQIFCIDRFLIFLRLRKSFILHLPEEFLFFLFLTIICLVCSDTFTCSHAWAHRKKWDRSTVLMGRNVSLIFQVNRKETYSIRQIFFLLYYWKKLLVQLTLVDTGILEENKRNLVKSWVFFLCVCEF